MSVSICIFFKGGSLVWKDRTCANVLISNGFCVVTGAEPANYARK